MAALLAADPVFRQQLAELLVAEHRQELQGPQGEPGSQGDPGEQGAQGEPGEPGPPGEPGASAQRGLRVFSAAHEEIGWVVGVEGGSAGWTETVYLPRSGLLYRHQPWADEAQRPLLYFAEPDCSGPAYLAERPGVIVEPRGSQALLTVGLPARVSLRAVLGEDGECTQGGYPILPALVCTARELEDGEAEELVLPLLVTP